MNHTSCFACFLLVVGLTACETLAPGEESLVAPVVPADAVPAAALFTATPLHELASTYFGLSGYFYQGSNTPPPAHTALGLAQATAIEPLATDGTPLPASQGGRIVFLAMGFSNTNGKWCLRGSLFGITCNSWSFMGRWKTNSQMRQAVDGVQLFNGTTKGGTTVKWDDPMDVDYDNVSSALAAQGLTPLQVQVMYVEVVLGNPTLSLPNSNADTYQLVRAGGNQMRAIKTRYPNVHQTYVAPRDYAGYAKTTLSPEPYAYETAFAVKWLIQAQITQLATGIIDPLAGDLDLSVAPWLTWGPYLWATSTPRADGLFWTLSHYDPKDGMHFSKSGETKASSWMMSWFSSSPFSTCWLLKGLTCANGGPVSPQFARPVSLISNTGWVASSGTELWDMLDESIPDDAGTAVFTPAPPLASPGNAFTVGLSPVTDPLSSTGHVIHIRGRKPQAGKRIDGTVELVDGSTVIATLTIANLASVTWTDYSYTLSAAQADAIVQYSALRLRVTLWSTGTGTNRKGSITQAYLETPSHMVIKTNTTTTITADIPDPSSVGQAVNVDFTVTSTGGTPTGNVTVTDGVDTCSATVTVGNCSITLSTIGLRTLTATYAGDTGFNGSTSPGAAHTVSSSTTTAITSHTPDPSIVGQAVSVDFQVTGGSTPTGTVTVSDGSVSCSGTLTSGSGSCTITLTNTGTATLVATYGGDGSHGGSASPGMNHTVDQASTTTAITGHTPDPVIVGQAITVDYTVVVNAPGAGTPSGTVTVSDGTDGCSASVAAGSCSFVPTTSGSKTITVTYPGDTDFLTSSDNTSHQVNTTGPVSGSQSSLVVSTGMLTASSGSSATTITLTARDGLGNPISGATIVLAATGGGNDLTQPAGLTDGSGVATGTLSSTGVGSKTVSATINGTPVTQTEVVLVGPGPADAGQSTATVPAGTSGSPTVITVQARDQFGNDLATGGETVVITVSGANTAGPISATDLGNGTYSATYTPAASGPDVVDITLNGAPISGSPYSTTVGVGGATQIQLFAGGGQSAPIGTATAADSTVPKYFEGESTELGVFKLA